ncbi:MAG: chalcone isomerase family protein, partial [Gammaproteobacteria bacterium]
MKKAIFTLILGVLFFPCMVFGKDIEGVSVPENITLDNGAVLSLNGAGLRTKFFFDIYVGALYLPAAMHDVQQIIDDPGPKRVGMYILYDALSKEKITSGWTEGFEDNNSGEQLSSLRQRLDKFNRLFKDLKEGDVVFMDYVPDMGTRLVINGQKMGTVKG